MKLDTNLYLCTKCPGCNGKWDSSILVGKKFPSKEACKEAESKLQPFPKPKP